jgi:hypothetical protein
MLIKKALEKNMINICFKCGENNVENIVDINGNYVVFSLCVYKNPFIPIPLYIVAGASGTLKSTV